MNRIEITAEEYNSLLTLAVSRETERVSSERDGSFTPIGLVTESSRSVFNLWKAHSGYYYCVEELRDLPNFPAAKLTPELLVELTKVGTEIYERKTSFLNQLFGEQK